MTWFDEINHTCDGLDNDPICLDIPAFQFQMTGMRLQADASVPSGQKLKNCALFPSAVLSISLHAVIFLFGLAFPVSLQYSAQVISVSLMPGIATGQQHSAPLSGPEILPGSMSAGQDVDQGSLEKQAVVQEAGVQKVDSQVKSPSSPKVEAPARKKAVKPERKSQQARNHDPVVVGPNVVSKDVAPANATSEHGASILSGLPQGGPHLGHQTSPTGSGHAASGGVGVASGPILSSFGTSDGPSFVRRVMPRYPDFARRAGREGLVVLRLTIDERGNLKSVEVVEGGGHGFDGAAIAAVRASTFAPAIRLGEGVSSMALLPVRFALKGS